MDVETSSLFSARFQTVCEEAKCLQYLGNFDEALKILEAEKMESSSIHECWLLKNCEKCSNIKKAAAMQRLDSCLENFLCSFEKLLLESQGVTVTTACSITEVIIISNILFLQLVIKTSSKSVKELQNTTVFKEMNISILRVISAVSDKRPTNDSNRYSWLKSDDEQIIQDLLKLLKILKIKQGSVNPLLVDAVVTMSLLFTLILDGQTQDVNQAKLVSINYELAKSFEEITSDASYPFKDVLILHNTETYNLCYQSSIFVALTYTMHAENEKALRFIDEVMTTYDFKYHLHLLLKACILNQKKEYESCLKVCQILHSKIKEDYCFKTKHQISLVWNIIGVCYVMQGKPNMGVRAFERSMKANLSNKAPLYNVVVTLKIVKQWDAEIECLQQILSISEQEATRSHGISLALNDFDELFISKLCKEHLYNTEEIKIDGSEDCLKLYDKQMDKSWILYELAESLYDQKRFCQAADAYLDLIRIIREGYQLSTSAPVKDSLHVFYKAAVALLNAERLTDSLTVCDYVLGLHAPVPVRINTEGPGKPSAKQTTMLEEHVPVLLCKCECLRRIGNLNEAISIGKRALSVLEVDHCADESRCKRQRLDVFADGVKNACTPWLLDDLKIQAYNNLAVAFIDANDTKQASQLFRNALKCTPGQPDSDVLYNFCKLLMQENLSKIALQNWNYAYQATENTKSLEKLLADDYKIILR